MQNRIKQKEQARTDAYNEKIKAEEAAANKAKQENLKQTKTDQQLREEVQQYLQRAQGVLKELETKQNALNQKARELGTDKRNADTNYRTKVFVPANMAVTAEINQVNSKINGQQQALLKLQNEIMRLLWIAKRTDEEQIALNRYLKNNAELGGVR